MIIEVSSPSLEDRAKARLKEIFRLASKLGWFNDYLGMRASNIERCMLAMADDEQLNKMKD